MKVLLLVSFLVGLASASFYDDLQGASDDVVLDFMVGMENSPSLREVMGISYAEEADQIEDDVKTQLGKTLKESLDSILEKIRVTVDHGKTVGEELVNKAKEIASKLKELGQDVGEKAKDLLERIKGKTQEWLRQLLEKLGLGKRGIADLFKNLIAQLDFKAILEKLKEKLAGKVDLDVIIAYIQRIFGHEDGVKAALIEIAKEKGIEALKKLIGKLIPAGDGNYSVIDTWTAIKEFFQNIGAQLKEKFAKFAEWLKISVTEGIENAKDKAAKLQQIAKQVVEHSKTLTKEAAREALEFFQPYKEDLGVLWDQLKETVRRVVGTSD